MLIVAFLKPAIHTFKILDNIYRDHKKENKICMKRDHIQPEKGSFAPLVFTTS